MTDNTHATVRELLNLIARQVQHYNWYDVGKLSNSLDYEELRAQPPEYIKPLILDMLHSIQSDSKNRRQLAVLIITGLLRKNQHYNEAEWIVLCNAINACAITLSQEQSRTRIENFPLTAVVQQIERYIKQHGQSEMLTEFIIGMLDWEILKQEQYVNEWHRASYRKAIEKLQALVIDKVSLSFKLHADDIGDKVQAVIENSPLANENALHQLLFLANSASAGKPSAQFIKDSEAYMATLGRDKYRKVTHDIIAIVLQEKVKDNRYSWGGDWWLCDPSKQFIKGIVWTMSSFSDKKSIELLGQLLEKSYEKIPGLGPKAAAIGNACAYTLGNMRGKGGLGELSRLKLKLKQNNIKKTIDKYLTEGAKKYGVSVEELKEMAVPDFHLINGSKTLDFEGYQLTIAIENSKVTQTWTSPDGKTMKSVPAVVKNSTKLTQKLKDVRKEAKEIQKVYSAQKQRIDNQFILNRQWDFADFEKYYLAHGLVAPITHRLIWQFSKKNGDSVSALFNCAENAWQNQRGEYVSVDDAQSVSLWHPVFVSEEEVIAWRDRIMDIECKQPIKQAFRELYLLTDAEIHTKTYSNRMAAHFIKQHQFKTLAVLRDWQYALLGAYDDGRDNETCSKLLTEYDLTAEFWIDEIHDYDNEAWNDAGIWLYVATDQVKFKNAAGETLDLVDVPKIVFSEIMRDVDLFVGVCSVGNDPEWRDNNGERQNNYWQSYSFGNLGEVAKTRKAVLERLLPRLTKLKGKAHIDGKFLVVEGTLRTYKIHIGSSNILMEPNDQYLCIVPARNSDKATDKLFIPFEGDNGLSIVLSKAFMLAEDTKIKDETITSQINQK